MEAHLVARPASFRVQAPYHRSMRRPRFALLFDGLFLELWHLRCLELLESSADLDAVIVGSEGTHSMVRSDAASKLMRLYAKRVKSSTRIDARERFSDLPRLSWDASRADEIDARIDFVLRLGPVSIPRGIHRVAHHGVWYFDHEGPDQLLPLFREFYSGEGVTHVSLIMDSDEDNHTDGRSAIIEEGFFRTHVLSYPSHRRRIEAVLAAWPARACQRLPRFLPSASRNTAREADPLGWSEQRISYVRWRAAVVRRRAVKAWERFFRHAQWNIGVLHISPEALLASSTSLNNVQWFPLKHRDGFLADPFAIARDNGLQILCEYFAYREGRGEIREAYYSPAGFDSSLDVVLARAEHMSYPFLLEDDGQVFCVPETAAANEVALFRAADAPEKWTKVSTILAGFPGLDSTVFKHDDRWWLMCTRQGPQEDVELLVWHAHELLDQWTPHRRNPVKTDVRGARPAGRPFTHGGSLYRPAQDCSRSYGGRVVVHRIIRLTTDDFEEEPVAVLEPARDGPYPDGVHTVSPVGDYVLIDGRRTVFVPAAFTAFLRIWAGDIARRFRASRP